LRNPVHEDFSADGNHVFQFASCHHRQTLFGYVVRARATNEQQNEKDRGTRPTTIDQDHLRRRSRISLAQEREDTDPPGGKSVPDSLFDDCFSERSIVT
jgi:hypothetical protein